MRKILQNVLKLVSIVAGAVFLVAPITKVGGLLVCVSALGTMLVCFVLFAFLKHLSDRKEWLKVEKEFDENVR